MKKAVALLLLIILTVSGLSSCTDKQQEPDPEFILDGKTYDMVLYDLNDSQHNIVANYNNEPVYRAARFSEYLTNEEDGEPIKRTYKDDNGNEGFRYDVYIDFSDFSPEEAGEAYEDFMTKYIDGENALLPMFGEVDYKTSDVFLHEVETPKKMPLFKIY